MSTDGSAPVKLHPDGGILASADALASGGQVIDGITWTANDEYHLVEVLGGLTAGNELRGLVYGRSSEPVPQSVPLEDLITYPHDTPVALIGQPDPFGGYGIAPVGSQGFESAHVVVGTTLSNDGFATPAQGRLYVNDQPTSDYDSDGLGDQLELWLGLCPFDGGPNCVGVRNPRDTDADGLTDRDEVLGRVGVEEDLALALWGASPIHKDAFVEVGWWGYAEPPLSVLLDAMDYFASTFDTDNLIANPDGIGGLTFHFDLKTSTCTSTACDLGGSEAVTLMLDEAGKLLKQFTSQGALASPTRDGVFRHVTFLQSSAYETYFSGTGGWARAWYLFVSAPVPGAAWDSLTARTIAHELGHTMGLGHGGHSPVNCKPNYQSIMSYAPGEGFASGASLGDDIHPHLLSEVAGVGLASTLLNAWGFNDGVDTENDPHYNPHAIDWNRNGTIDVDQVRGAPLWGPANCHLDPFVKRNAFGGRPADEDRAPGLTTAQGTLVSAYRSSLYGPSSIERALFSSSMQSCSSGTDCCVVEPFPEGGCGTWNHLPIQSWPELRSAPVLVTIGDPGAELVLMITSVDVGSGLVLRVTPMLPDGTILTTDEVELTPDVNISIFEPHPTAVVVGDELHVYFVTDVGNEVARVEVPYSTVAQSVIWGQPTTRELNFDAAGPQTLPITARYSPSAVRRGSPYNDTILAWVTPTDFLQVGTEGAAGLFNVPEPGFGFVPSGQVDGPPSLFWNDLEGRSHFELWYPNSFHELVRSVSFDEAVAAIIADTASFGLERVVSRDAAAFKLGRAHGGVALHEYKGHLQAVFSATGGSSSSTPLQHHMPFADGVFDAVLHNVDDFLVMHDRMCHNLLATDADNCDSVCRDLEWPAGGEPYWYGCAQ